MLVHFINLYSYLEKDYIAQKCLESWQKNMPNAKIKVWTEKDEFIQKVLNKNSKFLKFFQKSKNYGYLCDYLRLHIQYEFGGIYSELDQMLLKPLEIDEDTEFCHSLIYTDCVTTTTYPNYFKKGNKLLKYLIDILDNDFDAKWMTEKQSFLECMNTEWHFCLLRNLSEDLIKIKNELRINSKKFFKKEGCWWCLHFADWQLEWRKNIILIDEQLYQEESENLFSDAFFFVFGNIKDFKIDFFHHKIIDYKLKPLFLKFIKYQIYKSPKIKDKIIDVQNCLGDISEITEKDFEINANTFFKY